MPQYGGTCAKQLECSSTQVVDGGGTQVVYSCPTTSPPLGSDACGDACDAQQLCQALCACKPVCAAGEVGQPVTQATTVMLCASMYAQQLTQLHCEIVKSMAARSRIACMQAKLLCLPGVRRFAPAQPAQRCPLQGPKLTIWLWLLSQQCFLPWTCP